MNRIARARPAYRSLWKATGFWGPLWAVWVVGGLIAQGILLLTRPADLQLRQNVNTVFALGVVALMFQLMTRVRAWQDAQTAPPTPDAEGER
jgi:hypothetical protein